MLLSSASARHPLPVGVQFTYGTAGFRTKAELLDPVLFRVGLLATLRSKSCNGKTIGVMITASHNLVADNGVKLVDPMGDMLLESWEAHATRLANATTDELVAQLYFEIASVFQIDLNQDANVILGHDTRPSCTALVQACIDGLTSSGAKYTNFGLQTTPQIHYLTRCINDPTYGNPTETGYFTKLSTAFQQLIKDMPVLDVTVDCANGIGAPKLKALAQHLGACVQLSVINDQTNNHSQLNLNCGADFVKTNVCQPKCIPALVPNQMYASFDGDADRIVFYFQDKANKFQLLDGDRISALLVSFIIEHVRLSNLDLKVGVVQTAYANGNSTSYLKHKLGVPVCFTQTGVKHLHHKAIHEYDIGVYFEANGHGTVVYSLNAHTKIKSAPTSTSTTILCALIDLTNETVGDAVSDLLLVLVVLSYKKWDLSNWLALYTDLPSQLVKVVVKDRHMFKTILADTKLAEPSALQDLVDKQVAKFHLGRAFVRPSGTEDVVRVYAEAQDVQSCHNLAYTIAGLVFDQFGGVGERPKNFI